MDDNSPFTHHFQVAPLHVRLMDMFRTVGPEILAATRLTAQDLYKDAVAALMGAEKNPSSKKHPFDLWGSE